MQENISLILANLTPEDERRFHAARISYTGSTGPGAKPENYGGLAPYIATYLSALDRAVKAMGWHKFSIDASPGQWIVRCEHREYAEQGHGIRAEWVEGVPGAEDSAMLTVKTRLGDEVVSYTPNQASVLLAAILQRLKP